MIKCLVLLATLPNIVFAAVERDREGLTPLHIAAGAGNVEAIQALLEKGADLFAVDSKMGVSILHKAVYSGNAQAVSVLLQHGALINLQSPSNGDTPLHDAIYFRRGKDLTVIQTLLSYKPSLAIKNRAGLAPLESAKLLKADDVVRLLERYATDRQSKASRELMSLVKENKVSAVEKILRQIGKAVLSESDEQGFTPLLWASREGFTDLVKLLVEKGADPNQNDQWMGANSGHKAAYWGRTDVMKILVGHGLELNARGAYNGYTPLHDAVSGGHFDTAKVLIEAGADTTIKGHDGKTAFDIAKANGERKVMDLFKGKTMN
jgi:ankyrin repeat protein